METPTQKQVEKIYSTIDQKFNLDRDYFIQKIETDRVNWYFSLKREDNQLGTLKVLGLGQFIEAGEIGFTALYLQKFDSTKLTTVYEFSAKDYIKHLFS